MIYFRIRIYGDIILPVIRESADLLNNYGEISEFCHNYREPLFITKNGQGDLAVMGIEAYEEMNGRLELYQKILIGLGQIKNGETIPEEKMMNKIRQYAGF
jgi:PHD/YefM family antitoxin component YafN of YafNO toxin-antitoxin module